MFKQLDDLLDDSVNSLSSSDYALSDLNSEETEESSSEEEEEEAMMDQPLYARSQITSTTSNILFMSFAKKFQLTQDAFQSLIDLIRVHCPKQNNCVKSVFKLKSFFREILPDDSFRPKRFKYCNVCQGLVQERQIRCQVEGCPGQWEPLIFFDYLPIGKQFRKFKVSTI